MLLSVISPASQVRPASGNEPGRSRRWPAACERLHKALPRKRPCPLRRDGHDQPQCPGCTGFTSQFWKLEFLDDYDARFVIVTQGPIEDALAYKQRVGNAMDWYSTAGSSFGSDMGAPPGGGFGVNVFLRDGDTVCRTWHTNGRGCEQLSHTFPLVDLLPYGRQEEWQDVPEGWPQAPAYSRW